ncbi:MULTISPECIES: hypothetical protein [Clostridium]|uniref:CD-NTase associated protein 4-like DNA endonuclease domain-containing protein n=1 Tax=Clostridium frigoriphilum TaxID=443253 RepID=A0ABU7UVB8_9CLOT|nr:hypothetical protein [Clostridium sp. DSM 17811]MBU3101915.1 hypothetical protein [Clostridium sp. DSM 17811]
MKKPLNGNKEINTDAEASIKGIGLQKMRAVERLIKALLEDRKSIYCTIEHIDDVLEIDMGSDITKYITEQNKVYSTPFSINSEEIKNSLRIFFDNWRKVEQSENIVFVFYTNTKVAKEKKVGVLKEISEPLPTESILQLLIEKKYDKAFPFALPVFKDYYIQQHKKHSNGDNSYYEKLIEGITNDEWELFFNLIEWRFGEETEQEIRGRIKEYVMELCIRYNTDIKFCDKIIACLLDMIESRALEKDFLMKIVHVSEVKIIFFEFIRKVKVEERLDPLYPKWDQIKCDDVRNLQEKIYTVCPEFDEDIIQELEDDYVEGIYEQQRYVEIKEVKAYNYRIYKVCKRIVNRVIKEKQGKFLQEEVEGIFEQLADEAERVINDKAKTYKEPYLDRDMVKKTIIILFQDCFLALDKGGVA